MAAGAKNVRFLLADRSHDADIRRLLRESVMPGKIELSLRCEPSYFNAMAALGGETHTIVAIVGDKIACVGSVNIRMRYFNGKLARVGYLGHLRLAPEFAGRYDILRRGYSFYYDLLPRFGADIYFTSVASDNDRAKRFLESNIPGMPLYQHVGDLVTMLVRVRPPLCQKQAIAMKQSERDDISSCNEADMNSIEELLCREHQEFQFAPYVSKDEIAHHDMIKRQGFVIRHQDKMIGYASLWDQREFKQAVVTRYSRVLSWVRPMQNLYAFLFARGIALPRPGQVIASAFVTQLVTPINEPATSNRLLYSMMKLASDLQVSTLAIGLDARDPRFNEIVRFFRPHVYRTGLYIVSWPNKISDVAPDGRLFYPEIALL